MPRAEHPIVIFDGLCNLCSGAMRIITQNDVNGTIELVPMGSPLGAELLRQFHIDPADTDSFVVIKNKKAYLRSDAALQIAGDLRFPWSLARALRFIPRSWRERAYAAIAKNRYRWFGKRGA